MSAYDKVFLAFFVGGSLIMGAGYILYCMWQWGVDLGARLAKRYTAEEPPTPLFNEPKNEYPTTSAEALTQMEQGMAEKLQLHQKAAEMLKVYAAMVAEEEPPKDEKKYKELLSQLEHEYTKLPPQQPWDWSLATDLSKTSPFETPTHQVAHVTYSIPGASPVSFQIAMTGSVPQALSHAIIEKHLAQLSTDLSTAMQPEKLLEETSSAAKNAMLSDVPFEKFTEVFTVKKTAVHPDPGGPKEGHFSWDLPLGVHSTKGYITQWLNPQEGIADTINAMSNWFSPSHEAAEPGPSTYNNATYLREKYNGMDEKVTCPQCSAEGLSVKNLRSSLYAIIIHLNDTHKWTLKDIADWIETLPFDTSKKYTGSADTDTDTEEVNT